VVCDWKEKTAATRIVSTLGKLYDAAQFPGGMFLVLTWCELKAKAGSADCENADCGPKEDARISGCGSRNNGEGSAPMQICFRFRRLG